MANGLFKKSKAKFLQAQINMSTDTIKVALVDTNVLVPNLSSDDFLDDISSAIVGTPTTLTSKTFTDGVFDAADVTIPTVTGAQSEALVIFKDTGTPGTSPLIWYGDTGFTGLPVTPNGGGIGIQWNASGIFSL